MKKLLLTLLFAPAVALAQIKVEHGWSPATPPGARVAAGYVTIGNAAAALDRLLGAASPFAARVEMHIATMEGEVMKMRQATSLEVPAKGTLPLKPGGAHLMFVDIGRPFKEGDLVPVTLRFERAGEVTTQFRVARLGAKTHSR